jgi:siroheme synthase-like protein|tara:strand:- start:1856 stop:2473 length:618 start_codon:yes stop_codon:yes gene_type:complete
MVNINISSKRWLIVGGGEVATRRLKKIIESEGSVKLVGKSISKQIKNISKKNKNIKLLERSYRVSDLNSTDFVIACTNNKDLNDKIIKASRKKNILASNASNQKLSDFSFTSTFKLNKDISINFDTAGNSPLFSKVIRILFQENLKQDLLKIYKLLKSSRRDKDELKRLEKLILKSGLLKSGTYNNNVTKIIKELKKGIKANGSS